MGLIASRRPISPDPLINQLHRRIELVLACAAGLFIVYVTCLPAIGSAPDPGIANSRLSIQDGLQNIVLYAPLGFCFALALRRNEVSWGIAFATCAAGATMLSAVAEFAQQLMPGRVSSSIDVLCNVSGMIGGAMAAWVFREITRHNGRRIRDRLRHEPVFTTFLAAACIYFVLALVPFQLDLSPSAHKHLLDVTWLSALAPVQDHLITASDAARQRFDGILDLAATAIAATGLGVLACAGLRQEFRFGCIGTGLVAMWLTGMLACGVLVCQMFIRYAGFHVLSVPVVVGGTLIGGLIWAVLAPRTNILAWRRGLGSAALGCCGLICARELSPFVFDFSFASIDDQLSTAGLIPFRKSFSTSSTFLASSDVIAKFGRFMVLGILTTGVLRTTPAVEHAQASRGIQRRRVILGGSILAVVLELVQVGCPGRSLDITHVLVAVAGVAVGCCATQYWHDLLAAVTQDRGRAQDATPTTPHSEPQNAVTSPAS